jgi:hypothetical protein
MPDLNLLSVKFIPTAWYTPAAAPFVAAPRYQSHCAVLFAEAGDIQEVPAGRPELFAT